MKWLVPEKGIEPSTFSLQVIKSNYSEMLSGIELTQDKVENEHKITHLCKKLVLFMLLSIPRC